MELLHPVQDYRTVGDLQDDEKLTLEQDPSCLREYYGKEFAKEMAEFGCFFLDASDGDYDRVYGCYSSIPWLLSSVVRIKTPSEIIAEHINNRK